MRKTTVAIIRLLKVSNDIKNGVSEIEEQFDVMQRYRKSWKAAEKDRNVQILTATTEVRTTEHRSDKETRTPGLEEALVALALTNFSSFDCYGGI